MSQHDDARSRKRGSAPDSEDDVIISEETALPGMRKPPPTTLSPHDLATPYVLDALEVDEREAFERHLINCTACQVRVADLEEAALLLPDALVTPPADLPDAFPFLLRDVAHETLPFTGDQSPHDDVADREAGEIVDAVPETDGSTGFTPVPDEPEPPAEPSVSANDETPADGDPVAETVTPEPEAIEEPVATSPARANAKQKQKQKKRETRPEPAPEAAPESTAPEPETPLRTARPPGRIRPGVRPQPVPTAESHAGSPREFQITPAVVAALALGLVALGLFLWALLLLGRVGDLDDELDQQNQEITSLRQQANATAYTLTPTTNGPAGASGTFFFSLPDQQGALVVRGLDAAPNGWAFQIWFIDDDESSPSSGPTFQVDENGDAVVPLTADVATFDAVAVSLEPAGGSPAPTSQVILQGRLGGAAG